MFRAEYPGLVRELGLILGDRALAEDVTAEGFVELWRKWDRVSGLDRPGARVRNGRKPISTSGISNGRYIHLPVPPHVVTIDATTGRRLWDAPGWAVAATGEGIWTVDIDSPLQQRNPETGAVLRRAESPIETPVRVINLGGGVVGVVSLTQLAAVDSNGETQILGDWPEPPEYPVYDRGTLFVALRTEAVVAYDVQTP